MNEGRSVNVLKNTVSGVIQRFISIIANFIVQVIFIRLLGVQYAGVSSLFISILTALSLAELGIGTAIVYNLYKPIAERDNGKIAAYMHFYATAYRIVALVILGLGLCVLPFIDCFITDIPDVTESTKVIFLLVLLDTFASYLLIYKSTILIAAQKQRIVSNIQTTVSIIKCIILVSVLYIWKSYYAYLIISILITITTNLMISHYADKEFPEVKKCDDRLSKEEKSSIFKNILAMALYKVSGVVLNSTDNIIISKYIGTSTVGVLSNYNFVVQNVYSFIMQFFSATSSGIGNMAVKETAEREHVIFKTLNFIAFWTYIVCTVSILVLIQPFIQLVYGEPYIFSMSIVIVLLVDFFIKGMMSPITSFRTAHGLFVQGKYRPLIMALINIALSILLMKAMGLVGVFLATVISRLVTQVWYDPYIIYRHIFKRSAAHYFLQYLAWLAVTFAAGVCTWYATELFQTQSLAVNIIIRILTCLVIPNVFVVVLYGRTHEFEMTIGIVRHLARRIFRKSA